MTELALIQTGAEFSPCRKFRYRLWRRWADGPMLVVIGLNPSTADETLNDPTIRRCLGYARDWHFSGLMMLNCFSYRSTDPNALKVHTDKALPQEIENRQIIAREVASIVAAGGAVVAAWGFWGDFQGIGAVMRDLLTNLGVGVACLGTAKNGEPRHPLYLARTAPPRPYIGDGGRLVTERKVPA